MVKKIHLPSRKRGFDPWVGKIPGGGCGTHSSILAWEIPWTEEPGGLQSVGHKELNTAQQLNNNNVAGTCKNLILSKRA